MGYFLNWKNTNEIEEEEPRGKRFENSEDNCGSVHSRKIKEKTNEKKRDKKNRLRQVLEGEPNRRFPDGSLGDGPSNCSLREGEQLGKNVFKSRRRNFLGSNGDGDGKNDFQDDEGPKNKPEFICQG